jgi:phosphotransferase system enzyme I (PtsP)
MAAGRLDEALALLVLRVREALSIDAVSVYLVDSKHARFVLTATAGLDKRAELTVRIPLNEGLVGWVGRREEPINIENAPAHPAFYYDERLAEGHLLAFLGVPIIQHRKLYGVMTAQMSDARCFDDTEEAFLITLAAQLGGLLAHAEATGELAQLTQPKIPGSRKSSPQITLKGIACVPGVAIGTAVVVYPSADIDAVPRQLTQDVEHEVALLYAALHLARENMHRLGRRVKSSLEESEYALFDVYLHILDNDNLGLEIEHEIRSQSLTAQAALSVVIKQHVSHFDAMTDSYLRERASDLRDIGRRVLAELQSSQQVEVHYPRRTILVGEEITAAALAEVPEGQLAGVVSARGAHNSHAAILARALGVPSVMGVRGLVFEQLQKRALIVDGYDGQVFISPSKILLSEYKQLAQEEHELNQHLVSLRDKPADTTDGQHISLQVNTGLALDAGLSMSVGAEGVGLYRSEIPYMRRDCFPSEDEQTIIYRQTLTAFAPHHVTMRTLDIGGDKVLSYFPVEEDNPYLGWRGIRITLDHPDLFLLQVRAMMRASVELNNLRILLPMITTVNEVDEALHLIHQAYTELREEEVWVEKPSVGVMIEVPAAALQARELARRVDFLSVGSNDLTQYMLAVDRNNARVANLYDALHPAMLTTLLHVVQGAHAAGVEVSICGEMASDPYAVVLLLAMGFDMLSMNSASLPRVKWIIRSFSMPVAQQLLAEVLELEHASDIRLHVQRALEREGLGSLIRAGKV